MRQHVNELETAIVNLANTSQYKIADVDMAFRMLGGLGFTTGQILGGIGQEAIIMAQAMGGPGAGVSAADAAQLLGQSIYLFRAERIDGEAGCRRVDGCLLQQHDERLRPDRVPGHGRRHSVFSERQLRSAAHLRLDVDPDVWVGFLGRRVSLLHDA